MLAKMSNLIITISLYEVNIGKSMTMDSNLINLNSRIMLLINLQRECLLYRSLNERSSLKQNCVILIFKKITNIKKKED